MRAMQERGIRVPEDVSVIGFDGLPFSAMSDPPLTTVNVPCADIGRWAVDTLHQQIRGRIRATSKILVSTHLHIRKSTAPPKAAAERGSFPPPRAPAKQRSSSSGSCAM